MREQSGNIDREHRPRDDDDHGFDAIESFLRIDRIGAIGGVVVVVIAWLLGIGEEELLLVPAVTIIALVVLLTLGLRALAAGAVLRALALAITGNWLVALSVAFAVPQLWPVMIMTVLMPVVLATPFTDGKGVVTLLAAASVTLAAVSAIGLTNDDGGVVPDLEDELELGLVIGAVLAISIPVTLVAWNNNKILQSQLRQLQVVNGQLDASRGELAASRRRVVEAADSARQRIERDLHDGAQQRLVSLGVRLRLLESTVGPDDALGDSITSLISEADGAIDELRQLAHGIFPPLLESSGLAAALRAAGRRSGLSVDASIGDVDISNPFEKRALYFVGLEALANAAKYAPDANVTLRLSEDGDLVALEVADDGPGFDIDNISRRNGTDNMRDRMAAVGGTLSIESVPGQGTTVRALVLR